MDSGKMNIAAWSSACVNFSKKLKYRSFGDISTRAGYFRSVDAYYYLTPEVLQREAARDTVLKSKSVSENLSTTMIIHNADGMEFDVNKNSCYSFMQPVPTRGAMHTHDYIEIFYIISGTFSQVLLGETYTFHPGDVVITDKNCEHADILDAADSSILFLCVNYTYMEKLLKYSKDQSEFQRFLFHAISKKKREQSFLVFKKPENSPAEPLNASNGVSIILEQIVCEEYMDAPGHDAVIEGLMIRLLFSLGQDYTLVRYTDESASLEKLLLFELEKYIRNHPADVTTAVLEDTFHYHRNYYNNLLKKYRDKSLREYIQDIRIKKACELLKSTDLSVKEIAHEAGYENTNFFYQLFERSTGMKPVEYRKMK